MDLMLDSFLLYCDSKNLSRKTLASYQQTLQLFLLYLKNEHNLDDLSRVKTAHLRAYIKFLRERGKYSVTANKTSEKRNFPSHRGDYKKELSQTTIANYVRNLKVFFTFLHTEGDIPTNPTKQIENIKVKRKPKQLLSKDDLKSVLSTFDISVFHQYRSYIQVKLCLDTGCRASEICGLLPQDVDLKTNTIRVDGKGGKERFVYFSFKMRQELKRWMQYRDRFSESEYLFPTIRGTKLDIRNFERTVKMAGKKVGVDLHVHQLRNTFAKYYLLNGGDFATLSKILGHSSVEVTMKAYLDFSDQEIGRKYHKHSPITGLDL
ncbi:MULTISPECIES: tyrosine-type recombinase/integrase [Bacillaceae]|uniref:Tyrosine-type recombinase/integrase n=1 Tax=Evansella alkalicola TaxID=745819 RepID=A0ABS6K0H3_9BACI|nr:MULTISPECIES: tyrosine-type recombinase/integrase [Bacillaceae]MBU9724150.1 tyrosine-type recombinase/integrase [Bacillus alkalicola]